MNQSIRLKHIVDLETRLGYRLSQIDFSHITNQSINYSWGDESELHAWIRNKDANVQFSGSMYTISEGVKTPVRKQTKYPLIWLVTPVKGVNQNRIKRFDRVNLIVCSNTEEEWLNHERWGQKLPVLQAISDNIIDKLRGSVRIAMNNGVLQYEYENRPKAPISERGDESSDYKTLDLWDSVVLTMDILIDSSCPTANEGYYEFIKN